MRMKRSLMSAAAEAVLVTGAPRSRLSRRVPRISMPTGNSRSLASGGYQERIVAVLRRVFSGIRSNFDTVTLALVKTRIEQANAFGGPVHLINGDSHVFNEDHLPASESTWLSFCGQTTATTDLTGLTVDGISNAQDRLKARKTPRGSATPLVFRARAIHPPCPLSAAGAGSVSNCRCRCRCRTASGLALTHD